MNKLTYWILGLLIAVLGWIWTVSFTKLCAIETQLVQLQIDITQLKADMMDEERVREIVEHELLKRGVK